MNPITLSVSGVAKRYGAVRALDGVSFEARAGEAVALWGSNGAGKTTLMKAMLGLIAFEGSITVHGRDVRRDGKAARRAIGYVPQDAAFHDMSARATAVFYARLKKADGRGVDALLERVGLAEHADKAVAALSGGLRQRLALAIALLGDPPVLLLDEPTASLDAQAQQDYLAMLASLSRTDGKTIIFASHRLEEIELLAHRVVMLEHGKLVDVLTPAQLLTRLMPYSKLALWLPEAQRAAAIGHFSDAGLRAALNGRGTVVVHVPSDRKMLPIHLLNERGIPVLDFEIERSELN